ncbi:MAG: methyltransferase domain-containing protein, partial [Clostridia bacterium]|nr:methyltransferase domain-containing protein [Clostridia bacterium]
TGDNKDMARCRKSFLDKGYFEPLAKGLCDIINREKASTVLDICCGEGYYAEYISRNTSAAVYGFDLSKEMVRLAAKRKSKVRFLLQICPLYQSVTALRTVQFTCLHRFAKRNLHGLCVKAVTLSAFARVKLTCGR